MSYITKQIDDYVVNLLQDGGVGLLPTDTIYGLSAVALNKRAVDRVHELKARDDNKPLIVLAANIPQLVELGLEREHAEVVKEYWPGPLSAIFPTDRVPYWLELGTKSLAVRLPGNEDLRKLIEATGPIVSTSANLQGQEPAKSVDDAKRYFEDSLDFYVDVGEFNGQPSTLVKIENGRLKIVRQGAYKLN